MQICCIFPPVSPKSSISDNEQNCQDLKGPLFNSCDVTLETQTIHVNEN